MDITYWKRVFYVWLEISSLKEIKKLIIKSQLGRDLERFQVKRIDSLKMKKWYSSLLFELAGSTERLWKKNSVKSVD